MQLEITNHMYKTRLDQAGKVIVGKKKRVERNPVRQALPAAKPAELPADYCGSCYGAAAEVRFADHCEVVARTCVAGPLFYRCLVWLTVFYRCGVPICSVHARLPVSDSWWLL